MAANIRKGHASRLEPLVRLHDGLALLHCSSDQRSQKSIPVANSDGPLLLLVFPAPETLASRFY